MMKPLNQSNEPKKRDRMVVFMVVSGIMIITLLLVANAVFILTGKIQ